MIHPGDAVPQMEGVHRAILGNIPGFRQGGLDVAILIVFHQGVDHVGGQGKFVGGRGVEVIQRGDLAGIQRAVHAISLGNRRAGQHAHCQKSQCHNRRKASFHEIRSSLSSRKTAFLLPYYIPPEIASYFLKKCVLAEFQHEIPHFCTIFPIWHALLPSKISLCA